MTPDERENAIAQYLAYLAHARIPAVIPTSRSELKALLVAADEARLINPHQDSWEVLWELTREHPEEAWGILLESIRRCHDADLLQIGAGQLESFVQIRGEEFEKQIISEITGSRRFRRAFGSVYMGADFSARVGRRINSALRAAGAPAEDVIDWWNGD